MFRLQLCHCMLQGLDQDCSLRGSANAPDFALQVTSSCMHVGCQSCSVIRQPLAWGSGHWALTMKTMLVIGAICWLTGSSPEATRAWWLATYLHASTTWTAAFGLRALDPQQAACRSTATTGQCCCSSHITASLIGTLSTLTETGCRCSTRLSLHPAGT